MRLGTLGIICHGGSGVIKDKAAAAAGLDQAIREGYRLLRQSASAQDVVIEAVRIMEDNPVFNCGTGSSLTLDGRAEMDAAVMTQGGRFGGVCCITGVRNPILVAEKVMKETDHLLMCGSGATGFARKLGFAEHDVVTEVARQQLDKLIREGESKYMPNFDKMMKLGTVGAVATDGHGKLAAATSSGGLAGRLPGRIGDSAVPGAGTYAGPSGAVSCTGHGEVIIGLMLAKETVEKMKTMPGSVSVTLALSEARRRKAWCGMIGFDARGGVCFGHTAPEMAYGYMVADHLFMFAEEKKKRRGRN